MQNCKFFLHWCPQERLTSFVTATIMQRKDAGPSSIFLSTASTTSTHPLFLITEDGLLAASFKTCPMDTQG